MKKSLIIGVLLSCLVASSGRAASAEPILVTFQQVCLRTGSHLEGIQAQIKKLGGWEAVPPADQLVLGGINNNHTWHLHGDYHLGMVVAGNLPIEEFNNPRLCMLAMPRGTLTVENASEFLKAAGGQRAVPAGEAAGQDVFFAHLLGDDWVMVGIHLIPDQTHLQFLLTDLPDADVKAAIRAAEAEDGPAS